MWGLILLYLIVHTQADSLSSLKVPRADGLNATFYKDYRLPKTLVPSRYQIFITVPEEVLLGKNMTFSGKVIITFQVTEPTNIVQLHSAVNISSINLSTDDNNNEFSSFKNTTLNYTTETITLLLADNLTTKINYSLEIKYFGKVNLINMEGLYLSQYNVNGAKEYLVTTQFESTNARKVFPCLDEPEFKANFALSLTYPLGYLATSNTPQSSSKNESDAVTTIFADTLRMSTYLLAFTISKFNCTTPRIVGSTSFEVCSRKAFAEDRELALNYGIKILGALDSWTNYYYNVTNIRKLDQFAIPDFNAGAMENWGMVTYREINILWNKEFSPDVYKQQIIMIIAHEFSHMWFGNLLTTEWWNTTFLNEGFARYFQYFIVNQLEEMSMYELDKQFIIGQQHSAFLEDLTRNNSLTSQVWTPTQISNKFDTISYNKGACILRMVENVIGTDIFQEAVRQYIKDNVFRSVTPDDLWEAFNQFVPDESFPPAVTFDKFIDNWVNKAGFPIVSVTSNGSNIILEQKRFLYNGTDNTQWYIPITFISSGNATFTKTWLEPNKSLELSNILNNNSWIIVNYNSQGYYRVHYDAVLRKRLITALKSNLDQISDLDRAQIIDDTLNLARAGKIKYSEAFELLEYMKNETSYYPWNAAIKGLNTLKNRFGRNSELGHKINNMLLDLIEHELRFTSITNLTISNHITYLKLDLLWRIACMGGQEKCKAESTKLFQEFKTNKTNIHPNQRNIVYCNALRYSSNIDEDWNFLWNRLHAIDQPHETNNILSSLGCTSSKAHLKILLAQSINSSSIIRLQDINVVWSSVYSSSSEGLEFAFDYFIDNHKIILNNYAKATSIFLNIISMFTNEDQLIKLQSFINGEAKNSTMRSIAESGLQNLQSNFKWQSMVKDDLTEYFKVVNSGSVTITASIYLLITMCFLIHLKL